MFIAHKRCSCPSDPDKILIRRVVYTEGEYFSPRLGFVRIPRGFFWMASDSGAESDSNHYGPVRVLAAFSHSSINCYL